MTASRADALVLFGVTGDLAHKLIFPALTRLLAQSQTQGGIRMTGLPRPCFWSA